MAFPSGNRVKKLLPPQDGAGAQVEHCLGLSEGAPGDLGRIGELSALRELVTCLAHGCGRAHPSPPHWATCVQPLRTWLAELHVEQM